MRDWLTIEVVLAVLLVTSFTCVGMLALWAATSPRHWFVRTAVVFVVLSPLLAVPAHEVFATFVIECTVVAVGATAYRRSYLGRRFSLSALLFMVVVISISTVIATRLPRLNGTAWITISLLGATAGLATLMGAWSIISSRKPLAWVVGLFTCLTTGAILSMFDWFFPSVTNMSGWPPEPTMPLIPGFGDAVRPIVAWFFIPLLIALTTALLMYRWRLSKSPTNLLALREEQVVESRRNRLSGIAIVVLVFALVAVFPLYVLIRLFTPDPIPNVAVSNPNGHDDFIAAGRIAETSALNGTLDAESATAQQLSAEIKKCAKTYDLIRAGLEMESAVPVSYAFSSDSLDFSNISSHRAVARVLFAKGKLAELEGRVGDVAESYRQTIQFGYAVRRGGLLIDALVGIACTRNGTQPLYHVREKLPTAELDRCIELLIRLDAGDEPFDDYLYRDRVWSQRTTGWHGHLQQLLGDLQTSKKAVFFFDPSEYPIAFSTHQATVRLLIVELALIRYRQENNRLPDSLVELVPKYLATIPVDPLEPNLGPLKYLRRSDGYFVYSVGPNQVDDGGAAPVADDMLGIPQTGDLRLDKYFEPHEELTDPSEAGEGMEVESITADGESGSSDESAK